MALSAITAIIGLFVAWIIISIPLYLAAKVVAGRKATFGRALIASLAGPIVLYLSLFLFILFLTPLIGVASVPISLLIAIIILIWAYASIFSTSWLGGLAIAIIAFIISLIVIGIFSAFFGVLPLGTSIFHGGSMPAIP